MAEATGLTRDQVKGALSSMGKSGTLKIESKGGVRRITIIATGQVTAWTHLAPRREDVGRAGRLMNVIIQKAEAGEEMPRGQELADMIGSSAETATRDLRSLERLGLIDIQKVGVKRSQIIVVATGARTAIRSPGSGRTRRPLVLGKRDPEIKAVPADDVEVAMPPTASLVPCARRGCEDAAASGRAYCGGHEMEVEA